MLEPSTATDSPAVALANQKRPKGFQKGNKHAIGRPRVFANFKERLSNWLEHYTIDEIMKICANKKEFGKLVALDAIVVIRIMDAAKSGNSTEFAMLLDRLIGKPNQSITGLDEKPLIPEVNVQELARRTAFLLSLSQPAEPKRLEPITIEAQGSPDSAS